MDMFLKKVSRVKPYQHASIIAPMSIKTNWIIVTTFLAVVQLACSENATAGARQNVIICICFLDSYMDKFSSIKKSCLLPCFQSSICKAPGVPPPSFFGGSELSRTLYKATYTLFPLQTHTYI